VDPLGLAPCRYEVAEIGGAAFATLLDAIRATRDPGNVLAGRFRAVDVAEPDEWFHTGSVALADTSFRDLLTSDAARGALPGLKVPDPYPLAAPPRFDGPLSTLTLDGELAAVLVNGGAYVAFTGTAAEAKRMASAAVYDLIQDRHEDFRVFRSDDAWSPFFMDIAWDATWFLVDRPRLEVTLLALTDAD